jgi:hypothetical protein
MLAELAERRSDAVRSTGARHQPNVWTPGVQETAEERSVPSIFHEVAEQIEIAASSTGRT